MDRGPPGADQPELLCAGFRGLGRRTEDTDHGACNQLYERSHYSSLDEIHGGTASLGL